MSSIIHGEATVLSQRVRRITAPNPGMMTGPGTNTYLVGNQELAVIDPGPAIESHVDAIIAAASALQAPVRWILCTHTHMDHSPAANQLREATGGRVIGMRAANLNAQDPAFAPDQIWGDGDFIETEEYRLQAIHTPGHASNHLCFYLEQESLLFTGDHIMQGSTVVIMPPDGDMQAYLRSLRKLKKITLAQLAPAHGSLIEHPEAIIEGLIQHRLMREKKVISSLQANPDLDLEHLTPLVYDDVPPYLHGIARFSLLAHLQKLEKESLASEHQGVWVWN
ncbi:MBL fold metallo-hydrolase [Ketobacter sp. MCCC 1A13808]|uniref:MBL fold metallo-hydrolase n=1 Tax=Ketobacter sp. MCCC 1A13808 TaxID=2602738 RepID=UPI000F10B045|nr:MBL fold metallo-hydrolase [Ketobacter sp. MCCC 1A13808]MVF10990.1 MBL fold metallo-hydrolase [Ketobacter sp. MCCC 1A13808]RLP56378.1 MAG: MBL fold metallo-hydrolase [Ketobacter sp.]